MSLTKPNQQLRRDLKEAAAILKWAGVDLFVVSKRMMAAGDEQGAMELMKIAMSFQETEDKLAGYADEVKAARIIRSAEQKK
ncbi:hypothetical protein GIW77_24325 [Pseudomonas simiae]|uniref:Peptidase n=1 Tax=Pseudomonas simiae TaxID=321846 RepID=A0ABS9G8U0_9PSED|nr:hypothetical protein [Pseudomonas simiae]MCF5049321.1 hypothetical protein [Pseudomonas simiae]MCF5188070.1 hypothetical protein [Pseudomonas simiae]MCF5286950.1 hypothetical protein [Pseudomonas simiae]MCF5319996.1 hypothetical protein [Pseudomonas simiae]MCF5336890.1 hypothetical protein [Pseudomonas simiae]